MIPIPIAAAGISAGASLAGAWMNSNATQEANMMNAYNAALTRQATAVENDASRQFAREVNQAQAVENSLNRADNQALMAQNMRINNDNIALQREFAQNGVSWRVADAIKAGLHPLAALGGTGASFSPMAHISGGSPTQAGNAQGSSSGFAASPSAIPDHAMGNALHSMGSDISRAMLQTANSSTRNDTYTAATQALTLQNQGLQNELLKSQLARARQNSSPSMPTNERYLVDGQGQTSNRPGLVESKPMERTPGAPEALHSEPAAVTDVGYARTVSGGYTPVPSKDVKERIEDNLILEAIWAFRNNLMPSISNHNFAPPPVPLKQGHHWTFNPFAQEYRQQPSRFHERFTGRR